MDEGCAIEARGLVKRFGSFTAVDDLSMNVRRGEFMGLLGPNGSGKSTTLKMITGLIWPTQGTVMINGQDISDHRTALSEVGCVIETPEFYASFTPSEALQYVGRIYGLNEREIAIRSRDVLEEVKMWEWRDKPLSKFSKGMRQRTVLAQSMISNPSILILDEPTSGLDPRGMIEMRAVLSELKRRDRAMLISTHMLKEVSEMCGSVSMIRNGKLIASGDVNKLIKDYVDRSKGRVELSVRTVKPMTQTFIKDISASTGVRSVNLMGDYEVRLDFCGSTDDQSRVVDIVQEHGLRLMAMNEKGLDIEQLYMELTEGEVNVE
ncbi:ABC transporter ATP-binding protein [Methanomassiliicoccus luminyensis]|uniref:ABC transporter ATP-binding protein n=1 Tax=Methanomassiliicoccus luminyensis TaxID=1080712 RepID=UPI00035D060A|nr:ABC transporter ATP-binding protein [Methanomassiliicoccus luminyensis]